MPFSFDLWVWWGTTLVISGYCWLSVVIVGYQWLSLAISCYCWLSVVIVGYSWLLLVISGYCWIYHSVWASQYKAQVVFLIVHHGAHLS